MDGKTGSAEVWSSERLFAGPGDARERFRTTDWSATPLGPVESWPAELRMAVRTVIPSEVPMLLWWGPQLVQIFNDAMTPMLGDKYPAAVAQPAPECWHEVWDEVGSRVERAMDGTATFAENELLFMQRHGYVEETYWTFSYSPIRDESGGVAGVFVATTDITARVLSERRLEALSRLGTVVIVDSGASVVDTCRSAVEAFVPSRRDVPVAAIYLDSRILDDAPESTRWTRIASVGTRPGVSFTLGSDEDSALSEAAAASAPIVVSGIAGACPELLDPRRALRDHPIDSVLLSPLRISGRDSPRGILAVGLSPYRVFDTAYATFLELVTTKISGLLSDASAMDAERRRADALAALDAAKTRFLETVSHEFRTPLTLLLGPLHSVLDGEPAVTEEQRQSLETARRAAIRLRRLVDSLLEVTRGEAYPTRAAVQPADPAALTSECVDLFTEAARRAGLSLNSRIADATAEHMQLDPQMWSHIVLNLLSNAVKYTHTGSIEVDLDVDEDDRLVLRVTDTGVGIPEAELDHVFERFHRVESAGGRSREGIGLGLSLVSDWVRALGGRMAVTSEVGRGSTFTVSVPRVLTPASKGAADRVPVDLSALYLGEADRWEPAPGRSREAVTESASPEGKAPDRPRILVIEDNRDMRDYLVRLLRHENWDVDAVGDGDTALDRIRSQPPHLVLSDIMLPGRDGVALLEEIRKDPATSRLPVLLLTARAGAEAAIGGLRTGADDYITKPFHPDELVARVRVNLELSWLREQLLVTSERESDQLREALETRSTLSKAVGLMMATFRCDAETAFDKLVGFSQHRNVKVREIAEQIVGDYTASIADSSA
ncbi:ATP-binding protein [Rhodococcus sp. CH91]|uniref:ATP-binding protein n=1 Tax=Rhodococcus sp. CH91 TaxID=2910256 RepID=UPI001F4B714A|nr:ATP-binding protein [Rhodococcus sp. CH91]